MSKIFAKHGLRLNVEIVTGKVGTESAFPYIPASSWVKYMDSNGYLQHLFGLGAEIQTLEQAEPFLLDFWSKYELTHGAHQVYRLAKQNLLSLSQCVPCYLHGDEGTTYKRDGALVLSFFSPIGQGVASAKTGERSDDLRMNFVGHGFKTRFVTSTLMKARIAQQQILYDHYTHAYF